MVLSNLNLIDFWFDGGQNKCITVSSCGTRWVNFTKVIQICLNKRQMKDAAEYFLFNCYFTIDPTIFFQIIDIPLRLDPALSFVELFLYFSEVSGIK